MKRYWKSFVLALVLQASGLSLGTALGAAAGNSVEQILADASSQEKYTFILFYKEDNDATKAMVQTLKRGAAAHQDRAAVAYVNIGDASSKSVVERYKMSRAPMPVTLTVAPNGAVTGIFSKKLAQSDLAECFVTPAMMHCMKAMQEGKFVLVCVHATKKAKTPSCVEEFSADPQFKGRLSVVALQTADAAEQQFLDQMQIDPATAKGSTTVLLAPPGVLVGKFDAAATKDEMAAALHAAGKCCDDPNCKHIKGAQANPNPGVKRK